MTTLTIQDVSRRSGLSGPTLRYYEEIGLIGPIDRDPSSRTAAIARRSELRRRLAGGARGCGGGPPRRLADPVRPAQGPGRADHPRPRGHSACAEGGAAGGRAQGGADLVVRSGGLLPQGSPRLHRGGLDRPRHARLPPYPRSKAIAERAAWDFIESEGGDTQLVVMNPTSSLARRWSGTALDADLLQGDHRGHDAGAATPALRRRRCARRRRGAHLGDGHSCCRREALPAVGGRPDDHLAGLGADPPRSPRACRRARHSRRGARRGPLAADDPQRPRQAGARLATTPAETTIVETVESVRELGLLENR